MEVGTNDSGGPVPRGRLHNHLNIVACDAYLTVQHRAAVFLLTSIPTRTGNVITAPRIVSAGSLFQNKKKSENLKCKKIAA